MKKTFKVVMLPTEKASSIGLNKDKLYYTERAVQHESQHLYILSDDEIKGGDWYLWERVWGSNIWEIQKAELTIKGVSSEHHKKIVATTDNSILTEESIEWKTPYSTGFPKIPESFIQAYIKSYNEGNTITEVDLEMEIYFPKTYCYDKSIQQDGIKGIKTRPDNTVIVHQSKMYSIEDMQRAIKEAIMYPEKFVTGICYDYSLGNKWIQNNL